MRKLPVYLLLDVSGSMFGEPLDAVKSGVNMMVSTLRQDPYALETAHISVITFNHSAEQVVPLTELVMFQEPMLTASGQTSFGEALTLLSDCVKGDVKKTTSSQKGDWKPLVFIMTDGLPTDDWHKGLKRFQEQTYGMVVACAAGEHADTTILKQVTNNVVSIDKADTASIQAFFKWVSTSISVSSMRVENESNETTTILELPPPPDEVNIVL
ncbi:VWA domain-containing protein [Halosquirtibacter xylanolyticus]|uniref:vWA domain-containing protein n=1 Tax=Halosquirtibacter xylanolyticus TaxID=3374599 RepID=UPI0037486C44|nr:VWA domain-containing protein [Prolixibacteraceae bacterium]